MRIEQLRIINFKGLKEIEFKTNEDCIMVVGPNAVGKSTLFESIRINKAFLFPNVQNEAFLVLHSLKAITPDQQTIIPSILFNDYSKKIEISILFSLDDQDIALVKSNHVHRLIISHLRNTNRFPSAREPFADAQFLSSEQGRVMFEVGRQEIEHFLETLESTKKLNSTLYIDQGNISGANLLDQEFLTILCEATGYAQTYLNYFPADRSLPYGDQPVQIGQGNASQQLQSYVVNPQLKYQLIKQFIINAYLSTDETKQNIADTFALIFDALLPGKSLAGVEINLTGNLSILIKDSIKGTEYDIDSMSSGEKNLLLTLLFMDLTTVEGGIILFDEPELHLNPAVQKNIIQFLVDKICKPKNRQIILCTHSPEMFATAFERDDCNIYHLISDNDISPIYKKDKAEVFAVLQKLGSTSTDLLSTKGLIYLEGPHDAEILEHAISLNLPGFVAKFLGGRQEIEKSIKTLLEEDKKGRLDSYQLFLFDLDNKPADISPTNKVRIQQWDRYCLENYLLHSDAMLDTLKDIGKDRGMSRGSMPTKIKEIAFKQILRVATKEVLNSILTPNHYIKINELICETSVLTAQKLKSKMHELGDLAITTSAKSENDIVKLIESKVTAISDEWQSNWIIKCDGKTVVSEIHREFGVPLSQLAFKKKILDQSRANNYENWILIEAALKALSSGI